MVLCTYTGHVSTQDTRTHAAACFTIPAVSLRQTLNKKRPTCYGAGLLLPMFAFLLRHTTCPAAEPPGVPYSQSYFASIASVRQPSIIGYRRCLQLLRNASSVEPSAPAVHGVSQLRRQQF